MTVRHGAAFLHFFAHDSVLVPHLHVIIYLVPIILNGFNIFSDFPLLLIVLIGNFMPRFYM